MALTSKSKKDDNIKRTEFNKDKTLSDAEVRPRFGSMVKSNMRKFMSKDSTSYGNSEGKTTAGKVFRGIAKGAETATRVVAAPVAAATSVMGAGIMAAKNAIDQRKNLNQYAKAQSDTGNQTNGFQYKLDNKK